MTSATFDTLPLSEALGGGLVALGYTRMTPIQAQSLPHLLAGRDLVGQAQTGSGKTAAFALAVLHRLDAGQFNCQALVLCPTRELAAQVAEEFRRLATPLANIKVLTLCGGTPIGPQKASLEHGAHVIVGTPGRIDDHLRKKTLRLERLQTLVLDEADRMLDMGFIDTIAGIIRQTPKQRQTLLFSATFPDDIERLSREFQSQPLRVTVESEKTRATIRHQFFAVSKPKHKLETLLKILAKQRAESCLIFCKTRQGCAELAEELKSRRHSALALHGDMEQKDRDLTLLRFGNGSARILVATDVAARGLDVDDLALVINYDMTSDADTWLHRVGRTGRAGKAGLAITLLTEAERFRLDALAPLLDKPIVLDDVQSLPGELPVPEKPAMVTLALDAGRKNKLRPGDILGALTGEGGLPGSTIGKITIQDFNAYVAVARSHAREALEHLKTGKVKGKSIRARRF
ncbi:MAG: ATP-dependent RNA helicase DbpA [Wenzhouxiangella sp.]